MKPPASHDWVMKTRTLRRGLGITAGLEAGLAHDLAAHCGHLGYHSLWSNDEPTAPGLVSLSHFAAAAPQLELGVGVLPLNRHRPAQIAAEVDRLGLDPEKLWLGVGSGSLRPQIEVIRRSVAELREHLPKARIVVAAMRPRLCRVGGAIADGVLLNWMLPAQAARARRWVREGAKEVGREAPIVAVYVRVAVGAGSKQRSRDEEGLYRNVNEGHRKHFDSMNAPLGSVGVASPARSGVLEGLAPYQSALELPIVRVLAKHDATALIAVADAAAPSA
jgi:alkanesulfonate monooxygenase SsuD/methylene tetrahydromethanopterin reductase-like flavin-dependent oxidoreductase (luciferase family)